ncbi:hypothetical protein LA6_000330 [Marinibacterium anthonyi]|nr:hypothetical protein LA6_000330 [Marinibacterium anthonyi]
MPDFQRPKGIAYIHWGNSWQLRSFQDFGHWIDDLIYIHDLPRVNLDAYRCVVLPDAMDAAATAPHAAQLNAYRKNGGFQVVFLQGHADWLDVPGLNWTPGTCRDWLWWTKGERLEIHLAEPFHPVTEAVPLKAMSWHWGGSYTLPEGARPILSLDDGGGHLFLDLRDGKGRLMLATLDPHSHNGQRFMPATTAFLQGFYPWLNRELGIDRAPRNRVTYLQCSRVPGEWYPDWIDRGLAQAGFRPSFRPLYDLDAAMLEDTDILYLPFSHDEYFLESRQGILMDYLARGGSMILCAEPCRAWLPFLSPFRAVPSRPFSNIKVRVRDDRFGIWAGLGEDFDGWKGIFGQYARGWSDPPAGAHWLTDVGAEHDPKPADWLWRYPDKGHRGGFVFMHNGDNLTRYPDHGPGKEGMIPAVAGALQRLMEGRVLA